MIVQHYFESCSSSDLLKIPLSFNAIGSRFCLLQALIISTGVGKPLRGIKYPLTKSFIESLHVEKQKMGRKLIVLPSHED